MAPSKPSWVRVKLDVTSPEFQHTSRLVNTSGVSTVCEEAHCPNITECWAMGTATFMIMGDTCTRGCKFCAVKTAKTPPPLDPEEPKRLAESIKKLGLTYVVLTSVDRDDLPDQGANHFAKSIQEIKTLNPNTMVEVLTPDFQGNTALIDIVANADPIVYGHNIETVKRLTPKVRDRRASYQQSLDVLAHVKQTHPHIITKSSIMVGLGETIQEIIQTMEDLLNAGVDILTIGQYLQPSKRHYPLHRYVTPEEFETYKTIGEDMGFKKVFSGPLVRSSYRAAEIFLQQYAKKTTPNDPVKS